MSDAIKYPKTPRLTEVMREGEPGDWKGAYAVVEEKVDGANMGLWFEGDRLRIQSRGHVLRGGEGERQFWPAHGWAGARLDALRAALAERYVLYGEWCYAKNKAFYDKLPDWFIGFDVLDRASGAYVGVEERDEILRVGHVTRVVRLWSGRYAKAPAFGGFIGRSMYKSERWREALSAEALRSKVRSFWDETDDSDDMEGVYIRLEVEGRVVGRMKAHRPSFQKVRSDHWRGRALIRNRLEVGPPFGLRCRSPV